MVVSKMQHYEITATSRSETDALGKRLAQCLQAGQVISLVGDLGAGKTTFVRSIAVGLGVAENLVSSPTFMLIQEYPGRLTLFHFDTYRVANLDEFLDLGAEEYFYSDGVCLIEWGDRVKEILPEDHLRIEIAIDSPSERTFHFSASGPKSESLLDKLRE